MVKEVKGAASMKLKNSELEVLLSLGNYVEVDQKLKLVIVNEVADRMFRLLEFGAEGVPPMNLMQRIERRFLAIMEREFHDLTGR